jgi:phosphonate transport system substrate-binding protein
MLGAGFATAAGEPQGITDKPRLEIGISPFLPARTLIQNYQPLRDYLELELKEAVEIVTARDYRIFHERIERREYPLIITVVNSAYLAHHDVGYVPMLRPQNATYPVLVTSQTSALQRLAELRDQRIALPDPLAVISMQAGSLMGEAGLHPGKDVQVHHLPTHSAAVNHVLAGEVAAAIVSNRALQQIAPETRARVRVVQSWEQMAVPGVVFLTSPLVSRERRAQLTRVIMDFVHSPKGQAMMQAWSYGTLVPASAEELETFAPYGAQLKAALAVTADSDGASAQGTRK